MALLILGGEPVDGWTLPGWTANTTCAARLKFPGKIQDRYAGPSELWHGAHRLDGPMRRGTLSSKNYQCQGFSRLMEFDLAEFLANQLFAL